MSFYNTNLKIKSLGAVQKIQSLFKATYAFELK